ncbi:hypothetical protein G6F51_001854 [Rhizopus arrhizus]|uniref:Uncharacterized protein n=2 Tax=Rhizopus TaxID=4842 RepID=A0A9P7CF92_RHIOR|nr:hypothetical protein G6F51_001854 [Rhizopus arrhizus]
MDQAQAMFSLANAWLKVKPETIKNCWQHTKILAFKERTICDFEPVEYPTSALPLEEEIIAELNGMLPGFLRNFDNKVTDVSQLSLGTDESKMIVCYTTSTINNEETAEGNVDETEENDNTEQDEQRFDIVECKRRLREAYETILMYEASLNDLDRKLHRRIRMRLANSCAELNKSKEQTDLRSYFTNLEKISTQMGKHPYVQDFAGKAKKYLKLKSTQDIYQEEFDKKKEKEERLISKRKLSHQTQLVFEAETLLKGVKRLKNLNEQIIAERQESSSSKNVQCSIDNNTSASSKLDKNTKSLKETLYACREEIHERYKQGKSLIGDELKTMKYGLSCILDLSETRENVTRCLFEPKVWSRIVNNNKKFIMKIPKLEKSLQEKWEAITTLIINILCLVDANQFILEPSNYTKVSERDFAYQIWLPLLKKLFHINNDLVRIKVRETVLSGSTYSKADLYPNYDIIVGFRVDIRVIFDFKQDEFDIACGESCISLPGQNKLEHDKSKLLREGKLMQTILQNVIMDPKESISWMLQLSGLTCSFSTSHNTKYSEYHVNGFFSVIEKLFMFRNSVEKTAHKLNNSIRTRLDKHQERSLQNLNAKDVGLSNFFRVWRVDNLHRIIPTKIDGDYYQLCKLSETEQHMLFTCIQKQDLWNAAFKKYLSNPKDPNCSSIFQGLSTLRLSKYYILHYHDKFTIYDFFAAVIRFIWKAHWQQFFELTPDLEEIVINQIQKDLLKLSTYNSLC